MASDTPPVPGQVDIEHLEDEGWAYIQAHEPPDEESVRVAARAFATGYVARAYHGYANPLTQAEEIPTAIELLVKRAKAEGLLE